MPKRLAFCTLGVTLAFLMIPACSTQPLTKIEPSAELPDDLPDELKEKFKIAAEITPAPPAPEAEKAEPEKKKTKGKKAAKVEPAKFAFPSRRPAKDPLWVGEKQVMDITYLGLTAGSVTLEIHPYKEINRRKVYHVHGRALSSKVFSLVYRINDAIETFFDYEGLFSHRFHLTLDESKQTRDALELYDSEKKQTFYWNRWNHHQRGYTETKEFFPIEAFPQDSLSALYYVRTLPLEDGSVVSFPVVSEGKTWEAVVTVLRREMMDTPMGKVRCIVLKPDTKYQGVLQKRGDSFIWVTDDERRFVVRVEAKVKIGSVLAVLREVHTGSPQ